MAVAASLVAVDCAPTAVLYVPLALAVEPNAVA